MTPHPNDPKGAIGATKTPLHLLPPVAEAQIAWAHAEGAKQYGPWNWRESGVSTTTYIAAIRRHLAAYQDGEDIDTDSGVNHLAKIGACVNILLDAAHCGKLIDDRSKPPLVELPELETPQPLGPEPELPPLPKGFTRMERRGWGWKSVVEVNYAFWNGVEWIFGVFPYNGTASGHPEYYYVELFR